jgi:ergothioneine biosynthesis protein EgtB
LEEFHRIRRLTEALCAPLSPEDCQLQGFADASPPKWHLAHTTWFFDRFILQELASPAGSHVPFDERFLSLFNSYYQRLGVPFTRGARGVLSRPGLAEVHAYRAHVDEQLVQLATRLDGEAAAELERRLALGLHHEQQHQELILTDIKYSLSLNPLAPSYFDAPLPEATVVATTERFLPVEGGIVEIGHAPRRGSFAFDNESPCHRVCVGDFALASRLVTNAEFEEFVRDGGYRRSELWLADGWDRGFQAPLYWRDGGEFTLHGLRPMAAHAPVTHVSYYEADAYARWRGCRLPTEAEWEIVARRESASGGNLLDEARLAEGRVGPEPAAPGSSQLFGDVWEWTASAYLPYPGFRPLCGALGEYNAKFMASQHVLRGGSCATPRGHVRATYRNFFPLETRWQFTGVRLARDL